MNVFLLFLHCAVFFSILFSIRNFDSKKVLTFSWWHDSFGVFMLAGSQGDRKVDEVFCGENRERGIWTHDAARCFRCCRWHKVRPESHSRRTLSTLSILLSHGKNYSAPLGRMKNGPIWICSVADIEFLEGEEWLWEPNGNWGGLGLRESFMHFWIRTWA